jgi:hypothetical protein
VGQEFFINNQTLENKIRQLLPSQGGAGAGFDLSASTQIIPVIDVTESAEGSNLRQDIQSALGINNTAFAVKTATTSTIVSSTGFFRVIGTVAVNIENSALNMTFNITDGITTTNVWGLSTKAEASANETSQNNYDFIVKISAGESLRITSDSNAFHIVGSTRQIADISGNLTAP